MKAGIRIKGDKKLDENLRQFGVNAEREIQEIIDESLLSTQGDIVRSIQRGPATGTVYQKYIPRREHQASAPGQAPQTDTGALASSVQNIRRDMTGWVFSRVEYASHLEFGTQNMAERPYFHPAVERERPRFVKRYDRLIDRAAKGII